MSENEQTDIHIQMLIKILFCEKKRRSIGTIHDEKWE